MVEARIITGRIDVNEVVEDMIKEDGEDGALVMFLGFVKGVVNGQKVISLRYEAYEPLASRKLAEIAEQECKGVSDVRIYHRVGELKPGEPAIYIFVKAKKRSEAFEVARKVLERVKHEVPIYKLEVREDGEYWVVGDGKRIKRAK